MNDVKNDTKQSEEEHDVLPVDNNETEANTETQEQAEGDAETTPEPGYSDKVSEPATEEPATSYLVDDEHDKRTGLGARLVQLPAVIAKAPKQVVVAGVLGALVLVAGAVTFMGPGLGAQREGTGAVVALVNGSPITEDELSKRLAQVEQTLDAQLDESAPLPEDLRDRVLDELINLELLSQKATAEGYTTDESEVSAELDRITEMLGGAEQLETQLLLVGLTKEELADNIATELAIRKYLEATTEVGATTVAEEELRALYDASFTEGEEGAPSYDEVRPFLEQQAVQQKTSLVLQQVVDALRAEATIEKEEAQ